MKVLPWNNIYCECCGQSMPALLAEGVCCATCQQTAPVYTRSRAPLHYSFPIDCAVKAMKYRRQLHYVPAFALLLHKILVRDFSRCDGLVPVPLHWTRFVRRGFNQAQELCKALERLGAPAIVQGIVRSKRTSSQSDLGVAARRRNVRAAFAIRGTLRANYPLIVDDVMTTGATCEQLARALLRAGACQVGILTIARASVQHMPQ